MFKKIALFFCTLMFMVLIIGVSMTSGVVAKTNNFALILATGGLGDQSFNDLTYEGMVSAKKELGINFDYVEPKAISNYEIYQSEMAASGDYELIITVGFDQADALTNVAKDYPNQIFVVGNHQDDYAWFAAAYWGKEIKEFVSIQDYNLYLYNESIFFEKKLVFKSQLTSVPDRRQIWIGGGIGKSENDDTNYEDISLGIGYKEEINLKDFKLLKKYNILYLSEKT